MATQADDICFLHVRSNLRWSLACFR